MSNEMKFKSDEPRFKVGDVVRLVNKYANDANFCLEDGTLVVGAVYELEAIGCGKYPYELRNTSYCVSEDMLEPVGSIKPPQYNPRDVAFHRNTARWCEHSAQWWLEKAIDVQKERGKNYDKNEERSAGKVADIFNILRDKDLTEADVFLILQILKQVRYCQHFDNPHEDSLLDNIAYASLFAEAAMRKHG